MKVQTLSTTAMTPIERQMGRFMRAPDGHEGGEGGSGGEGGNQASGGNNEGGNSGESGGSQGTQNNGGQARDFSKFWDGSGEEPAPSGESAGGSSSGQEGGNQGGNQGGDKNPGQVFAEQLQNMTFGEVFTPEAIESLAENRDPKALNQGLQALGREATKQAFLMSAQLFQQAMPRLMEQMRSELRSEFGNRDNEADLIKEIPSAANPALKPLVKSIFDRAMTVTKNNRPEAIAMTKDMLKFQTEQMSGDLGINQAPGNSSDNLTSETNWVDELLGRE